MYVILTRDTCYNCASWDNCVCKDPIKIKQGFFSYATNRDNFALFDFTAKWCILITGRKANGCTQWERC